MRRWFLSILLLLYFVEAKKEIFELERGPRPDNPDIGSLETHLPCPDNCECEEKCTPCNRPDFNFLFQKPCFILAINPHTPVAQKVEDAALTLRCLYQDHVLSQMFL